jgi:hypothetical protein
MIGFIGTSLQLQPVITAHTLNCFWTTSVLRVSLQNLSVLSESRSGFYSLQLTKYTPFITAWEPNRNHRFQGFHSVFHECHVPETVFHSQATVSFLSVYNFQCPYPRNLSSLALIHVNYLLSRNRAYWRSLLSNRGSIVACVATGMCLAKRSLADSHIPSQKDITRIYFWRKSKIRCEEVKSDTDITSRNLITERSKWT